VLQTDFRMAQSREALYELSVRLPRRSDRLPGPGRDHEPQDSGGGLSILETAARRALAEKTFLALRKALGRLSARDRVVLRLHVEAGLSVADVARALGEEQKALYRKRDSLFKQLRSDLEADGIRCGDAHELLSTLDWESALTVDMTANRSFLEEAVPCPPPVEGQTDRREGEP
jgi:hypothetical protein